jgi:hypothetical protein
MSSPEASVDVIDVDAAVTASKHNLREEVDGEAAAAHGASSSSSSSSSSLSGSIPPGSTRTYTEQEMHELVREEWERNMRSQGSSGMTPMTGSGQSMMSDDNMTIVLQKLESVAQLQKAAASVASALPSVFLSTDSKPTVQLSEVNSSSELNEAIENVHNLRARGQDPRAEHVLTGKLIIQIKEGMIPEVDQNIFDTSKDVLEVLQRLLLAATKREQVLKGKDHTT